MADAGIYMNVPAVETMSRRFHEFGDILASVNKALIAALTVLKATAFIGLVGGFAIEAYIQRIQPNVEKMSKKMIEISQDLIAAVKAYRDNDRSGSQRFMD